MGTNPLTELSRILDIVKDFSLDATGALYWRGQQIILHSPESPADPEPLELLTNLYVSTDPTNLYFGFDGIVQNGVRYQSNVYYIKNDIRTEYRVDIPTTVLSGTNSHFGFTIARTEINKNLGTYYFEVIVYDELDNVLTSDTLQFNL